MARASSADMGRVYQLAGPGPGPAPLTIAQGAVYNGSTWVRGAGQVEGAGVFRGLRRGTPSRRAQWKRSTSFVALAVGTTAALVMATATAPAAAQGAGHGARAKSSPAKVAFTHPADSSTVNSFCQPTTNRPCPRGNNVWSGYVVTPGPGHPFSSVSASWVQPVATCPQSNAWALFWVGLDGWSTGDSSTVEQGGTSAECVAGNPVSYQAWWEMYPTNSVTLTFPIAVHDHMSASVVYSAADSTYTVTVTDATSGQSLVAVSATPTAAVNPNTYTVTVDGVTTGPTSYAPATVCSPAMPCQNTSAEWVVEAPGGNGTPSTLYPLAHFRPVIFTQAAATDSQGDQGSIIDTGWSDTAIDLMNTQGYYLASVMRLRKGGTQFRDVWDPGQHSP
jgi:hypothetical protein